MDFILPEGFYAGSADNNFTGVTVIVVPKGAVGGVDVRGGAPGTRETDLLSPYKMMNEVHAVTLAGGSAFGLEAASGVMRELCIRDIGYKTGGKIVPIVPSAVIYDLLSDGYVFPDIEMGKKAVSNALDGGKLQFGSHGAGKGATVAKIAGYEGCKKGGLGGASASYSGVTVSAVFAVNALGEIFDHNTGAKIAAADGKPVKPSAGQNTTIGCVMTDALLNKVEANKLASICHNGLARTIRPVHTDYDGDTIFALSKGDKKIDFTLLCSLAEECVCQAIENAVKFAAL